MSFFRNKYCCYGSRCHFKHEERKLDEIDRSYFTYLNQIFNLFPENEIADSDVESIIKFISSQKVKSPNSNLSRLPVFSSILHEATYASYQSFSSSSRLMARSSHYLRSIENYNNKPKFTLNYFNPELSL
jgi:hypothetical protein